MPTPSMPRRPHPGLRLLAFAFALVLLPAAAQQCADGIDNDGDGHIDLADPHCRAAYDNDESSFRSGAPGDDMHGPSSLDCWFDGNSGSGDDGCSVHACCLIDGPCPPHLNPGTFDPAQCEVSIACLDNCLPLVKPGCDCFGCCTLRQPGGPYLRALVNPAISPDCTLAALHDPAACQPCRGDAICRIEPDEVFGHGFEPEGPFAARPLRR
jgi:hypothetical protein